MHSCKKKRNATKCIVNTVNVYIFIIFLLYLLLLFNEILMLIPQRPENKYNKT